MSVLFWGLILAACNPALPNLKDAHRDYTGKLLVFPGAEGFGVDTPAGRGGEIVVVDTLDANGPGCLRAALTARGPRVVVFEVGGVIRLNENIEIRHPFLTVAGQTAPEPGITIAGAGLVISTHDVLVQHLAIRPGGATDGPDPEVRDAVAVIGEPSGDRRVHHVVLDHLSLSWAIDEVFSTWYPGVADVTLSNSLVTEALDDSLHPEGPHSKGVLVGDHTRRVSGIRNIFAYNDDRNPIVKGDASALFVNNFVYDPGRWPVTIYDREGAGPSLLSLEDSVFVRGRDTPPEHETALIARSMKRDTQIYFEGIRSWDRGDIRFESSRDEEFVVRRAPVSVLPLTRIPPDDLEAQLLQTVGSRPSSRNPVDQRIIDQIQDRSGRIIDRVNQVGGLGEVPSTRHTLELPAAPSGDDDGDGYTNLEAWLHTLSAAVEVD